MKIFHFYLILLCILCATLKSVECGGFFKKVGNFITGRANSDDSEEDSDAQSYKLGSLFIRPALNLLVGGDEEQSEKKSDDDFKSDPIEATTPYNYAKFAYSPGYYIDSLVKCPNDVLKGQTITITCRRRGLIVPCDDLIFAQDTAQIQCKTGYEYPKVSGIHTQIECKQNGKWSAPIFECVPACGKVTKMAKALVIHGSNTDISEFPWNVAIYKLDVLVCSGSIVSERVILSAAHCFFKETARGIQQFPLANFEVATGKYFRDKNAPESSNVQYFKIAKVDMHEAYFGYRGNYDADIAVVTLDRPIVYHPHIAPICLNLNLKTLIEKQAPPHGTMGLVVGYGYTEADGQPSDRLKKIEMPIVETRQCKEEASDGFKPFVTSDKFCAGYNDGTGGVCRGDSGAGFVTGRTVDGETVYHIHGIVSNTRLANGGCDLNFYTMFTHVQNYVDLIKHVIEDSKSEG